ncbi:MAG: TetR/AcrR family transcriptional regulator [Lachnospiraceae bacterium]
MAKTRVSKDPEERRAEIITAARYLFDKNGIEKTRVSDIVKHIGVAQGVFYYYFRSKDEIVEVVTEEVIKELKTEIHAVTERKEADFFRKLSDMIELYFSLIDQFTGDGEMVLPDFDRTDIESAAPLQKTRDILMEQMIRLVEEGTAQGVVEARYCDYAVWTLEAGLRRIAQHKLPTREIVYVLTEQILCLPQGELLKHCRP